MKNLILFFGMVVFMYLYSYILGGETSMVMVYMLIFSPLVSIFLIFPLKKRIVTSVEVPSYEVEKGGVVKVNVHLENKSFMPIPFINIEFCKPVNFRVPGTYNEIISLGPFEKKVVIMEYTAKSRGVGEIGVSGIWLRDYINIFRIALLKNSAEERVTGEVTVLPRIVSLKPTSKILLGSSESVKQEASGTTNINLFSLNGEPGYEFREYMPGDPLHKVHWKLSARNETLMVRKDEGRGLSKKRLFLDSYIKPAQNKQNIKTFYQFLFGSSPKYKDQNSYNIEDDILMLEEKVLEALIAVANTFVKTGREVELWLYEDGKWNKYGITDSKTTSEIHYRLASYKFSNITNLDLSKRLPLIEIIEDEGKNRYLKGAESTVFTGNLDNTLYKAVEGFAQYGVIVDTVSVKNLSSKKVNNEERITHTKGNSWMLAIDDDISEAFS